MMFEKETKDVVDVTIVLNIWKRSFLTEQLKALSDQTVLPKEIWIIHYEDHQDIREVVNQFRDGFPSITTIESSKNLKYFGRFSLAINITTKFAWLVDDDVIPGCRWLANCCYKCEKLDAIITCTGRRIPIDDYQPEHPRNFTTDYFIGDFLQNNKDACFLAKDTPVDYGCQSYFFKTEWLSAYWSQWPKTFLTGEDIHLSATCKTQLNVGTVVLAQMDERNSGNLKKSYGNDEFATWKKDDFLDLRAEVIQHHVQQNQWKPLLWPQDVEPIKA